jgi:hypothetical protein
MNLHEPRKVPQYTVWNETGGMCFYNSSDAKIIIGDENIMALVQTLCFRIEKLQAENKELGQKLDQLDTYSQMREEKLKAENKELKEALKVTANQLEGVELAFRVHGNNLSVSFFIEEYERNAKDARAVLEKYKEK